MSKDKPEVGDVWKHNGNGNLLHIIEIGRNYIDFIGFDKYDKFSPYYKNSFSNIGKDERYNKFTEFHTYIGKSKVKIEDLFKTENE